MRNHRHGQIASASQVQSSAAVARSKHSQSCLRLPGRGGHIRRQHSPQSGLSYREKLRRRDSSGSRDNQAPHLGRPASRSESDRSGNIFRLPTMPAKSDRSGIVAEPSRQKRLRDKQLQRLHEDSYGSAEQQRFPPTWRPREANVFPPHPPQAQGCPSQNEQVRNLTDVDVMMHIGVEQPRYDGKLCQRQPHVVACSLLKGL